MRRLTNFDARFLSGSSDAALKERIIKVLSDQFRRGSKPKFSVEQIVQIVAIACEDPGQSERPVTHWTRKELADEAVKRGIVEQISPRSVGRNLKRGHLTTPSQSLLAMGLILMTPLLLGNSSARSANCTKRAPELLAQGIHVVSTDEMTGIQADETSPSHPTDGIGAGGTTRVRVYSTWNSKFDC